MKVFTSPQPDEKGKFLGVVQAFPNIWTGRVLDVGCRSSNLKKVLSRYNIHYIGLDLYPPADVLADLEEGLPFQDQTCDVVVALDVLEHIHKIHKAFDELCRVAKRFVVITLPNAYELKARMKYLRGHSISGKYGLSHDPPRDRHKWIFSWKEAREFVHGRSITCGFTVREEGCLIGPRRAIAMGANLVRLFPNLLSPSYLVLLERL